MKREVQSGEAVIVGGRTRRSPHSYEDFDGVIKMNFDNENKSLIAYAYQRRR